MKDYYKILGVSRDANQAAIKKKFREMAHECHPDKCKGDDSKFKEISEAYSILGDPKKRASYDNGGSGFQGGFGNQGYDFSGAEGFDNINIDLNDIFSDFFAQGMRRRKKGQDILLDTTIDFRESILGTQVKVKIPYRTKKVESLNVTIPPNMRDRHRLILRGHGESMEGGDNGDLYLRVSITPDKHFRSEGSYIIYDLPVLLSESLLGVKKEIESIESKKLKISIPIGTSHGELLRIRHRGAREFLVRVAVIMPKKFSSMAKEAIETLKNEGL